MGRNYLWHHSGDASNAVLAAVGYNFRRLIKWLRLLLCLIFAQFTGLAHADRKAKTLRDRRSRLIPA
jgi:hypothetical protein